MRKESNVEKALLSIAIKNFFVPKVALGSCFRRNDKPVGKECFLQNRIATEILKEKPLLLAMIFSLALHGCLAYIFIPSSFTSPETLGHPIEVVWETKDSRPSSPEPKMPLKQKEKKATPSKTSLTPIKKVSVRPAVALSPPLPSFHEREKRGGESPGPSRHAPKRKVYHPLPSYPWICRKRRQQGVVALKVKINEEGHVTETVLHKSSGHTRLDEVALEALKTWTFAENSCTKTLSIAFRLSG